MTLKNLSDRLLKMMSDNPDIQTHRVFIYNYDDEVSNLEIDSGFYDDEYNFREDLDDLSEDEVDKFNECVIFLREISCL